MIPATSATGIPDSILNVGEFLSDHWLAEAFPGKLKALAAEWKARDDGGGESTPKALAGAGTQFNQLRLDLPRTNDPGYPSALTAMHAVLLQAAGFDPSPQTLTTFHGDSQVDIPLLVRAQVSGGEMLHVLQAQPANSADELLSGDALLVEPVRQDPHKDKPTLIRSVADAITLLFLVDPADSPRRVLVVAGPWLLLTDAERWSEGRYLAFDIDTALARRDNKPTGELAWHAGLWSADVLLPPPTGEAAKIEEFSDDSVKHAVGVSADLREGLRLSVELIANEALAKRRAAGLPVEGIDELPGEITTQTLRFLYRILFLLFAEARPELGILPVGAPEYGAGYGIDRLRELIQVPLSPQAAAGSHLHDSLDVLFQLVNTGHGHTTDGASDGLVFEPLQADLFSPDACRHIDSIRLGNATLQKVLELLLLSKQATGKNKQRGYVSYAQLGINQLGAVYEGLMAYTGFIAAEDLVELAKDGDPAKGTWMVPVDRAGDYDEKHLVKRPNDSGALEKVVHKKGSFVYRLAGRDRQRSASYYTPEILTRTVVKHALAELITDQTTAEELLEYRICEPALGSGAFANEAINQLAGEYLQRRQKETDQTIDPAHWQDELQKVKAWIALHRVYGVDLNATAVELAEVSMWLNVMHPGLQAPWFGLHLRRGNSLIGARRATYHLPTAKANLSKTWHSTPPKDRHLADGDIGANEVHHFLLPATGWGAAGDAKEAKELAPARAEALRTWARGTRRQLTTAEVNRLAGLATRVERLWALTQRRLQISEHEIARTIDVWNHPSPATGGGVTRAEVENALFDPDSPYQRLRLAMDAWCALYFWPVTDDTPSPPSREQWIATLEALLGIQGKQSPTTGQTGLHDLPDDFHALGQLDENEAAWYGMAALEDLIAGTPWLATARAIAEREGFFHWELDFAHAFARGGFDLIVGNPPWVRPTWQEAPVLAEIDAELGLVDLKSMDKNEYAQRRQHVLAVPVGRDAYLAALTSNAGVAYAVADPVLYPQLAGASNLYRNFILLAGRLARSTGTTGLLHPDDHLMHDKSGDLREWIYPRLRRRWAFINELLLFKDLSDTTEFGISIYGAPRAVRFLQSYGLYHPATLEASLTHDGNGPVPAFQLPTGGWDLRPHRSRIVIVDEPVLAEWAAIIEPPKTAARRTRALNPVVQEVADALAVLARQKHRMAGAYQWTRCWDEDVIKRADGYATWSPSQPLEAAELVLQPPHFSILTPFAKQPQLGASGNNAFVEIDVETIDADFLPHTNYTLRPEVMQGGRASRYYRDIRKWDGVPVTDFWRLAWRRRLGQNMARTLHAALIPPGPAHVEPVHTLRMLGSVRETALVAGSWAALPLDFLVKTMNIGDLLTGVVDHFALLDEVAVQTPVLVRVLRLNAMTRPFSELLEEVWDPRMSTEDWTSSFTHLPGLAITQPKWTGEFALRIEEARRAALVELDALVSLAMGLDADQLVAMYDSTFPVLRKYESGTWFDAQGHLIAAHHQQAGFRQQKGDFERLQAFLAGDGDVGDLLERYSPPFRKADREAEMRAAYAEFKDRLGL